jgi:succinoglycan biosynthesis protein ExoO
VRGGSGGGSNDNARGLVVWIFQHSNDRPAGVLTNFDKKMRSRPVASVIIPTYNGAAFLADAIESACRQSLSNIEIIVSDDASTDTSPEIVAKLAGNDLRIRLIRSDQNAGPAAARNRALTVASGEWIAVLDSDDLMHPERLETLIGAAAKDAADIVADDLLFFDSDHIEAPRTLLRGQLAKTADWLDVVRYVRANVLYGRDEPLGYLKPIFRSSLIAASGIRYDERLRISEDFNFVLRLMNFGARFRVYPFLMYFYRRHNNSISHSMTQKTIGAKQTVDREFRGRLGRLDVKLDTAMRLRIRSVDTAFTFDRIVDAIKRGDLMAAARLGVNSPRSMALLRLPVAKRLKKVFTRGQIRVRGNRRQVCVLARQRFVGGTNGSSVYVLELARALAQSGLDVHLLSPSPTTLGRWPFIALRSEMAVFKTIRVRGTVRIGRFLVSMKARACAQAMLAVAEAGLLRLGVLSYPVLKPAAYAIASPLTREDQLFLAKHVPRIGDILIADYCFLTDAFPYALRPDAKTAVIMHDLFSSRGAQFAALGSADSVVQLTEAAECALLAKADTIVAIQKDEGEWLRNRILERKIIVAPMAARPVAEPQAGRDDVVLFVGSSAAPNVDGLRWFLQECWPKIRALRPSVILRVAGTVCQKVGRAPSGVQLLGLVDNLTSLYAECGLFISPLRAGSGLKIKLIEALALGKAVVATTVTLQGVADTLRDCVRIADEPNQFVDAVLDLACNGDSRRVLGARGLAAIGQHFSDRECYAEFVNAML